MTARRRAVALAALLALAGGCGVRTEQTPRAVDPPEGVSHAWATRSPTDALPGAVPELVYFVRDGEVVGVTRNVDAHTDVDGLVDHLLRGPTDAERRDGLTSALLGNDIVGGVARAGGVAEVELTAALGETGRTDQILAFAQIVCTLTARPEVSAVRFTQGGRPVGVPRADGSLSAAPATRADYANLVAR